MVAGLTMQEWMMIGCVAKASRMQEDVRISDRYPALRLILWSDPQTIVREIVHEGNKKARPNFIVSRLHQVKLFVRRNTRLSLH